MYVYMCDWKICMQGTKDRNWVQMKKCGYLKAIYFNPCDGPQDYPNCAVQMLI